MLPGPELGLVEYGLTEHGATLQDASLEGILQLIVNTDAKDPGKLFALGENAITDLRKIVKDSADAALEKERMEAFLKMDPFKQWCCRTCPEVSGIIEEADAYAPWYLYFTVTVQDRSYSFRLDVGRSYPALKLLSARGRDHVSHMEFAPTLLPSTRGVLILKSTAPKALEPIVPYVERPTGFNPQAA